MVPRTARVRKRRRDGPDTYTLDIEPPPGDKGGTAPFLPGQFNMLTVFGVGEVPISLSGDPAQSGTLVHTVRAVGPVSTALVRLSCGDAVGLRGPFGTGWPVDEAEGQDVVLVTGGLGLAPLRPALYRLLARRERYGKLILLYGTRTPADILFRRELESWRRRLDLYIDVTVDHAPTNWRGNVGVVTTLIPRATFDPLQTTAFVCGPEIMMRFSVTALRQAGLESDCIYLSLERNMKCAVGFCGHCQFGTEFVCRDGPVFPYGKIRSLLNVKGI